jgi:hypothetical protein
MGKLLMVGPGRRNHEMQHEAAQGGAVQLRDQRVDVGLMCRQVRRRWQPGTPRYIVARRSSEKINREQRPQSDIDARLPSDLRMGWEAGAKQSASLGSTARMQKKCHSAGALLAARTLWVSPKASAAGELRGL